MFDNRHAGSLTPRIAFALTAFALGELGDGLNIFQGIYLVNLGWNEGSVGIALSLMGLTALLVQTIAGDIVDKTVFDRRLFLIVASIVTAISASAVLLVQEGNQQHGLMYCTKIVEGIASSFIGPCLAALTLANFGPDHFDAIMASNVLWGHVGSVISAIIAGSVAYMMYPNIQLCFLVIGASALVAIIFIRFVPQGDPLMGRGFHGAVAMDAQGQLEPVLSISASHASQEDGIFVDGRKRAATNAPEPASYMAMFLDQKTLVLCLTGWSFHFANANVLLVLGELMSGNRSNNEDDDTLDYEGPSRSAIPLIAGAIVLAQLTMSLATIVGDKLTGKGVGRKPLFMAGLLTLPIRCALVIWWQKWGDAWLLSTQILDGLGGGFFGLLHPFIIADITFGTGRFNLIMGLSSSCFGLGGTMSNFFGQMIVEYFGHTASLAGSFFVSLFPIVLFALAMPETYGRRGESGQKERPNQNDFLAMT